MPTEGSLFFNLIWTLMWALALVFVFAASFRALELLPLNEEQRATLSRLRPLLAIFAALAFSLFAAKTIFGPYKQVIPLAMLLVLVAFFVGSRSLVGDIISGIALRAERSLKIGDQVKIGETKGRIARLDSRSLLLETLDGDSALIPYSQATKAAIVQTRAVDQGASHSFALPPPQRLSAPRIHAIVERAALEHHWGAISKSPNVQISAEGQVQITVFTLSTSHAPEVEEAVRQALAKADET